MVGIDEGQAYERRVCPRMRHIEFSEMSPLYCIGDNVYQVATERI